MAKEAPVKTRIRPDGLLRAQCFALFQIMVMDKDTGDYVKKYEPCKFFDFRRDEGCVAISEDKDNLKNFREKIDEDSLQGICNRVWDRCARKCKYQNEGIKENRAKFGNPAPHVHLKWWDEKRRLEFIEEMRIWLREHPVEGEQPELIR